MPFIQNVSQKAIEEGVHMDPSNAVLIRISDPAGEFNPTKYRFKETDYFQFLDAEEDDGFPAGNKINDHDAKVLVEILKKALESGHDVVVHCVAGLCRSGAVAEVGIMMGFKDSGAMRIPNRMVKHKMMKALGWTYDSDEPIYQVFDGQSG